MLTGQGITSAGHHLTTPVGSEQARAIRRALAAAGPSPADAAHASGTPAGDYAEVRAIAEVLGPHPAVTAIKPAIGQTLGGAGALAAIVTLLSMHEDPIPATLKPAGATAEALSGESDADQQGGRHEDAEPRVGDGQPGAQRASTR
ncbi:hypothetical protein AB0F30_14645 [Streptomyces sp. NPDC029006]|uniref:hypothetical protein n=1 Tax=Streptomyces sp. NPDC029006 TaxID=3155467 RepID=UPI0033E553FC